jgi:hypothetical protein
MLAALHYYDTFVGMHMNPEEAVLAHIDLHSEHSIAIHFV